MPSDTSRWDEARIHTQKRIDSSEQALKVFDEALAALASVLEVVDPMERFESTLRAALAPLNNACGALELLATDARQTAQGWEAEMDALEKEEQSWVYFIGDSSAGTIKIGYSKNLAQRLSQLQTATTNELQLLGSLVGGSRLERRLHEQFSSLRVRGEWFRPGPELIQYLREHCISQEKK